MASREPTADQLVNYKKSTKVRNILNKEKLLGIYYYSYSFTNK